MRRKSSKLNHVQLNPSKAKESLLAKKKKVMKFWYLTLAGFFITVFVVAIFI